MKNIVYILFYIIIFLTGSQFIKYHQRQISEIYDKHPLVLRNCKYSGKIKKIKYQHGTTFLQFEGDSNHSIPWAYNYNYKPSFIADFLTIGDSIVKPANSDSIFIFREEKSYYFILGEYVIIK